MNRDPNPRGRFVGPSLVLAAVLALSGGCATGKGSGGSGGEGSRASRDGVAEIHLFGLPVALDLDGRPGADAVGIRIYASNGARARGIPIREGRLEVVLYDGAFDAAQIEARVPLRTWTFGASELAPLAVETSLGTGYQLALRWAPARPASRAVTVLARYHPPKGQALSSEPNSVPL